MMKKAEDGGFSASHGFFSLHGIEAESDLSTHILVTQKLPPDLKVPARGLPILRICARRWADRRTVHFDSLN